MLDDFCKEQGVAAPHFADRCLGFNMILYWKSFAALA